MPTIDEGATFLPNKVGEVSAQRTEGSRAVD
jgi:hypothetical protein